MAVFTAIATAIATGLGMTLAAATTATFITVTSLALQALTYFGGMALSMALSKKSAGDYGASSPTYANGVIQTQTNQDLPIPLLYGTCKLAGNRIWQHDENTKTVKRIVGFAEGEITGFSDIRLNDIESGTIKGISINKYLGTSTQIVDPIISGKTHEERAEIVGSLRNIAYMAISVPRSNDIDANYNLTTIVKGRKIRVYASPNPTSYVIKYSENPAWVMFDFLTSYNGLGLCLNNDGTVNNDAVMDLFDLQSFIEAADFCDEELEYTVVEKDKSGKDITVTKKAPRFTFNMVFDSQTSARDLIDEIYRSCRGGLFTKNGKLQFKIDKAEAVSKVFTAEDIVKGSETFSTIPTEEHYDILKLVYISPDHEWQKVEAFAEIPDYRDGVPIEHSINCYSVTNFQQASRLAWYYVNSKRLCPYYGSFKTDYRAYDLEVGDVIKFDSLLMGVDGYLAKVTSVSDDGAGTFTINWRTYDERLYSDELGSKEPRVLVSNLKDSYGFPDDIQSFNVVQNQKLVEFAWTPVQGVEITYEIRRGETWENASIVASSISDTNYTLNLTSKGVYKYWIKARNKYNYSKNAKSDILNVQYVPNLNEVVSSHILEDPQGEFNNTKIYHNRLKLKSSIKWGKLSDFWQKTGARYYADSNGKWATVTVNTGSYTSQVFDIGASLTNIISFAYSLYSTEENQAIILEWRHSDDNITWSDWLLASTGSYQFRYYQVRITFNNPNGAMMWLSDLVMNVDVPDRSEIYTNRTIEDAVQGIKIIYETDAESKQPIPFIKAEPHVLVTPYNTNAYPDVIESKPEYCIVKLYTNEGIETTGSVNISVSGY